MKKVSVTLFAAVLTAALLLPLYALSAVADTTVSARHAALYEPVTDTFLYEKNGDDRAPMASTTKVMTALVVLEQANLDETVSIPPEACDRRLFGLHEAGRTHDGTRPALCPPLAKCK